MKADMDADELVTDGEEFLCCSWCGIAPHYGHALYCPVQSGHFAVAFAENDGATCDAGFPIPSLAE